MIDEGAIQRANERVAKVVEAARLNAGLSKTRLAEKAGLSQGMISHVEHGDRKPTLDTLLRICWALETDLWKLVRKAEVGSPD